MKRLAIVVASVLLAWMGAGRVRADVATNTTPQANPIEQLRALGFPADFRRVIDENNVDANELTDPNQVEYIRIGKNQDVLGELPPLPLEVFEILPRFPKLKAIRFEFFLLPAKELARLRAVENLRWFSVHFGAGKTKKSFNAPEDLDFLASLPNLEHLSLACCDLRDEMIVKMLPLKKLKRLELNWNYKLTHAVIPTIQQMPVLERLSMHDTGFAPAPIEARRLAARLKSFSYTAPLNRSDAKFSREDLEEILTFPRHTWNFSHRTDVPLSTVAELIPWPISSVEVESWRRTIVLQGTDADGKRFAFGISRPLSDDDLQAIGQMKELRKLSIVLNERDKIEFTDDGLRRLSSLDKLEQLKIDSPLQLTASSLRALSTMRSLRDVELHRVDFDATSLKWIRSTPQLERLKIVGGAIHADALADLAHAPGLRHLVLGDRVSHGSDESVVIRPPTRSFRVDNVRRLELTAGRLTVGQCEILAGLPALESLTITGPVTDEHLRCLASLKQLTRVTIVPFVSGRPPGSTAAQNAVTVRGIQRLRGDKKPIYWQVGPKDYNVLKAMADQFGWRFYGCSSGCCDEVPMHGGEWVIRQGRIRKRAVNGQSLADYKNALLAVRVSGPSRSKRLVVAKADVPRGANTLCLTDCRIDTLELNGWLPESIRLWGDADVAKIVVNNVGGDARTSLRYYFLEDVKRLTVPESDRIREIQVVECRDLQSFRLEGMYPNLVSLQFRGVDNLRYLAAPHRGDAPRLEFPNGFHRTASLPALRLLKLPGTATGAKPLEQYVDPNSGQAVEAIQLPAQIVEVDFRDTSINDEWLERLTELEQLRVVRIGECDRISGKAIASFRKRRPDVELDERTVHRPGDFRSKQ